MIHMNVITIERVKHYGFTIEKTLQNNITCQNFRVKNNYIAVK